MFYCIFYSPKSIFVLFALVALVWGKQNGKPTTTKGPELGLPVPDATEAPETGAARQLSESDDGVRKQNGKPTTTKGPKAPEIGPPDATEAPEIEAARFGGRSHYFILVF